MLYLEDRIVVCWLTGTFRAKTELGVLPLTQITGVTTTDRTGGVRGDRKVIGFAARRAS